MVINSINLAGANHPLAKQELTFEEYEALSEEEKMNGTLYCIKDLNPTTLFFVELTQEEYDAIKEPSKNTLYFIKN